MKNIDGKESNIATEFNEFKDTLYNKKVFRHKMKRTQGKKRKNWKKRNQQNIIIVF